MSKGKILVVEDEAIVALDLQMRLQSLGYKSVGAASNGEDAVKMAASLKPDLVLLDIMLDGLLGGIEAAGRIIDLLHIPVVFVTAYADEETLKKAKLVHPGGYVIKPIKDEELRTAIEIAIYRHQSEEKVKRLKRLYQTLSQVNQTIVHGASKPHLLSEICRIAVDHGGFSRAWILERMPDGDEIKLLASRDSDSSVPNHSVIGPNPVFDLIFKTGKSRVWNNDWKEMSEWIPSFFLSSDSSSCGAFAYSENGKTIGILWVVSNETEFFKDEEVTLLQEIVMDISFALDNLQRDKKRSEAERALRENQAYQKALLDCSPIPLFSLDLEGRVLTWNKAAEDHFGWTSEEVVGCPLPIVQQEKADEFKALRSRIKKGEILSQIEIVRKTKNGRSFTGSLSAAPIYDSNHSIVGIMAALEDISDKKKAEERLLESELSYRTLSDKLLRLQDQERRSLARELHDTVAQDLAAIILNMNMLQKTMSTPQKQSEKIVSDTTLLADKANTEIRSMSFLLHPPLLEELGLEQAVRQFISGYRSRTKINLNLTIADPIPRLSDFQELTLFRILQEGLNNAQRHSQASTIWINLRTDSGSVFLTIRDDGLGIPTDTVGSLNGSGSKGLGVGLLGMKERLKQSHGFLHVRVDKGTRLEVEMPIEKPSD